MIFIMRNGKSTRVSPDLKRCASRLWELGQDLDLGELVHLFEMPGS